MRRAEVRRHVLLEREGKVFILALPFKEKPPQDGYVLGYDFAVWDCGLFEQRAVFTREENKRKSSAMMEGDWDDGGACKVAAR